MILEKAEHLSILWWWCIHYMVQVTPVTLLKSGWMLLFSALYISHAKVIIIKRDIFKSSRRYYIDWHCQLTNAHALVWSNPDWEITMLACLSDVFFHGLLQRQFVSHLNVKKHPPKISNLNNNLYNLNNLLKDSEIWPRVMLDVSFVLETADEKLKLRRFINLISMFFKFKWRVHLSNSC